MDLQERFKLLELQIKLNKFLNEHPELAEFQRDIDLELNRPNMTQQERMMRINTKLIEQRQKLLDKLGDVAIDLDSLGNAIKALKDTRQ